MKDSDASDPPFSERQHIEKEKQFAEVLSKIEEAHPEFFFSIGRQISETVIWDYKRNIFTFDTQLRQDIIDECIEALKKANLFKD